MNPSTIHHKDADGITLITGGTGKTGRRIAERLQARGVSTRIAARSSEPSFDWHRPDTWPAALAGVSAVYIAYAPDIAVPGATEVLRSFIEQCVTRRVQRVVLLSGRGEAEAQAAERIVQESALEWTIVRASWFAQNFDEGAFHELVLAGQVALPAGDVAEPFVDVDDIAEVAAAALTEVGHVGEVYEVTGPRLMTFADAVHEIAEASGRDVCYATIPREAFQAGLAEAGVPGAYADLLDYLFTTVLDGRNASLTDGVERALGRPARDFRDYAREVAARGAWSPVA